MIFFNVLEIVAPVILLSLIGFFWVRLGFEYNVQLVTRLGMTLAVPCLIFVSLMKTDISISKLIDVSIVTIIVYSLISVISVFLIWILRLNIRTYLAPLIFGNTGNIGLPLSFFAFGQEGLSYAVVIFSIMAIYAFTFGVWLVSGGGNLKKVLKEPLVGATILGAIFLYNGWQTPRFLTATLELIGQMAIPLMLITLGVAISRLKPQDLSKASIYSALKFVVCFLCCLPAFLLFNLEYIASAILLLQVTTPVAVTSYLLATKYKADAESVASLVIISTLFSIFYIPIILIFLI